MKKLLTLLKWDFILLQRNQLIVLALALAAIYLAVFYLLKDLGDLSFVLLVLLFNDPVVTGFMFAGVLFMFEKNQGTLQAISVAPVSLSWYLISKALALAVLSTITSLLMAWAAHAGTLYPQYLLPGVFLTSLFFTFNGFYFAAYSRSFNHFLMYSIGFLILMGTAFLVFLDGINWYWLAWNPSLAGLLLMNAGLQNATGSELLLPFAGLSLACLLSHRYCLQKVTKSLQ